MCLQRSNKRVERQCAPFGTTPLNAAAPVLLRSLRVPAAVTACSQFDTTPKGPADQRFRCRTVWLKCAAVGAATVTCNGSSAFKSGCRALVSFVDCRSRLLHNAGERKSGMAASVDLNACIARSKDAGHSFPRRDVCTTVFAAASIALAPNHR